jgi:hypothetical protein
MKDGSSGNASGDSKIFLISKPFIFIDSFSITIGDLLELLLLFKFDSSYVINQTAKYVFRAGLLSQSDSDLVSQVSLRICDFPSLVRIHLSKCYLAAFDVPPQIKVRQSFP